MSDVLTAIAWIRLNPQMPLQEIADIMNYPDKKVVTAKDLKRLRKRILAWSGTR